MKGKELISRLAETARQEARMEKELLKNADDAPVRSALSKHFSRMKSDRKALMNDLRKAGAGRPRSWLSVTVSALAVGAAAAWYFLMMRPEETPA